MVKIRISYHDDEELFKVLGVLKPLLKNMTVKINQQGNFKKAYVEAEENLLTRERAQ